MSVSVLAIPHVRFNTGVVVWGARSVRATREVACVSEVRLDRVRVGLEVSSSPNENEPIAS